MSACPAGSFVVFSFYCVFSCAGLLPGGTVTGLRAVGAAGSEAEWLLLLLSLKSRVCCEVAPQPVCRGWQ